MIKKELTETPIYKKILDFSIENNVDLDDGQLMECILEGLLNVKEAHGEYFCPCKPQKIKENICPCTECLDLVAKNGRCHCGIIMAKKE